MTTALTSPQAASPTGPVALAGAPRPAGAPKPKPRKRVNTAEKRHQHNAIERQRRETLNTKFLVLARLLPSLAACRRPSKSAIVNGSISHLSHQRQQRLLASKLLRQLAQERDQLFAEVNQWRQVNGCQPREGASTIWSDEMDEVCQVEKETFGSFANYDDANEDEDEPEIAPPMNLEKAAMVAGSLSAATGLLTPRNSTDFTNAPGAVFVESNNSEWTTSGFSLPASVPFNAFINDCNTNDAASSSASPAGSSHQSTSLLTPPTVDHTAYLHTPSPHSTASVDEPTPASTSQTWTPQQLAFFQQQTLQRHQQQQQQQQQQQASAFSLNADAMGMFMQGGQQQAHLAQLMATMFPQQRDMEATADWRKAALGDLVQDKSGFSFGGWAEQAVGV